LLVTADGDSDSGDCFSVADAMVAATAAGLGSAALVGGKLLLMSSIISCIGWWL